MEAFLCPLSGDILYDPVLTTDGLIYEYAGVRSLRYSPYTGMPIKDIHIRMSFFTGLLTRHRAEQRLPPPLRPGARPVRPPGRILGDVVESRPPGRPVRPLARMPYLPPLEPLVPWMDSDGWVCPITGEIPTDPVVALDGHVYDLQSIHEWFKVRHTSPLTGLPMATVTVRSLFVRQLYAAAGHTLAHRDLGEVRPRLSLAESIRQADMPPSPPVTRLYLGRLGSSSSSSSEEDDDDDEDDEF